MPPRAIASRVRCATSSEPGSPFTSSASTSSGAGNFGAVPKPPWIGSNSALSWSRVPHTSTFGVVAGIGSNAPARWALIAAALASASSRRCRQAVSMAVTTSANDGIPPVRTGG